MANEEKKKDSAEKRHRQNLKARLRNRMAKSRIKTALKAFESAAKSGERTAAVTTFKAVVKLMDTAAGKKTLHKNTVSRKKSRLAKVLAAVQA